MNIRILADFKEVEQGQFHYGNMSSRYGANTLYFTRDGAPFVPIAGELHFSRCPKESWKRELLKMMDCGINVVSTYVFWNYHEEKKGKFDFSGDKDIASFLAICREIRLPCILRIGPWCHGEVIRGGFPRRIARMPGKRSDNPRYLHQVTGFWTGLYQEVKPYLDGETVIGIQLENEYTGSTEHIRTLRRIAESIGFCVPFFTMTQWPSNQPDSEFLPMAGGYPDAPWARGKHKLPPSNRFAIMPGRSEVEIGEDLHRSRTAVNGVFDGVPFASCETGPGNQVTQHRRPLIREKDGYGVGFAKFASGVNWLGYYMFHGGRNPVGRMMQENRLTGYPNNYPVIDYDFQAPLSRYGECRAHGDCLRLMHLFIQSFDPNIGRKQAFFPRWKSKDPRDASFLKCSVRMDEALSGYFFASTYERGMRYPEFKEVCVQVACGEDPLSLPRINVPSGAMFFYPFRLELEGLLFDYILAQPVARVREASGVTCYFTECEGNVPRMSLSGKVTDLPVDETGLVFPSGEKQVRLIVLPRARAMRFHLVQGRPLFAQGTVYTDNHVVYCETVDGFLNRQKCVPIDVKERIALKPCQAKPLPYNYFLYSHGRRRYYSLRIDTKLLEEQFDIRLEFRFTGLNLQVFSQETLINDYFSIDGKFAMCLREYKTYLQRSNELIIRAVPKTRWGVGNVYQDAKLPYGEAELRLERAQAIVVLHEALERPDSGKA